MVDIGVLFSNTMDRIDNLLYSFSNSGLSTQSL